LRPGNRLRSNCCPIEGRNPSCELGSVQITDTHNLACMKFSFTTNHARREQTLLSVTQCLLGAIIDNKRTLRMMEESDPTLAACTAIFLWNKPGANLLPPKKPVQDFRILARGDHHGDSGTHDDLGRLNFCSHATDRRFTGCPFCKRFD